MRIETERPERTDPTANHTPRRRAIESGRFDDLFTRFGQQSLQRPFVFQSIERAGTVYQQSAGTQRLPRFAQNLRLPDGTYFHIVLAPLVPCLGYFAKHPLAGTGGIHRHDVEPPFEHRDLCRLVHRHRHVSQPPLADVIRQNSRPLAIDFIRHYQPVATRERRIERRLSPRRGAKVQNPFSGDLLPGQHVSQELRRSLLHVISPGMESRIERKRRPLRQVTSCRRPGNRLGSAPAAGALRMQTDGCRRRAFERLTQRTPLLRSQFGHNPPRERFRQHRDYFLAVSSSSRFRSRRAQIFSITAASATKSSRSLSITSTSPR